MNALTPIDRDAAIRGNFDIALCMEADNVAVTNALGSFDWSYRQGTAELCSLNVGGAWINRDGAASIFGEDEVQRVEHLAARSASAAYHEKMHHHYRSEWLQYRMSADKESMELHGRLAREAEKAREAEE